MKFMLLIHMNPAIWEGLSEEARNEVGNAHVGFQAAIKNEMISTHALAGPDSSSVVRGTGGGEAVVTDGPYLEAKEFFAGYYLIECESRDRAIEIASMMPEIGAGLGIEVREVIFSAGAPT